MLTETRKNHNNVLQFDLSTLFIGLCIFGGLMMIYSSRFTISFYSYASAVLCIWGYFYLKNKKVDEFLFTLLILAWTVSIWEYLSFENQVFMQLGAPSHSSELRGDFVRKYFESAMFAYIFSIFTIVHIIKNKLKRLSKKKMPKSQIMLIINSILICLDSVSHVIYLELLMSYDWYLGPSVS